MKFKIGEKVWCGDFHYSEKCEVVRHEKGGFYILKRSCGRERKVQTRMIRKV